MFFTRISLDLQNTSQTCI